MAIPKPLSRSKLSTDSGYDQKYKNREFPITPEKLSTGPEIWVDNGDGTESSSYLRTRKIGETFCRPTMPEKTLEQIGLARPQKPINREFHHYPSPSRPLNESECFCVNCTKIFSNERRYQDHRKGGICS